MPKVFFQYFNLLILFTTFNLPTLKLPKLINTRSLMNYCGTIPCQIHWHTFDVFVVLTYSVSSVAGKCSSSLKINETGIEQVIRKSITNGIVFLFCSFNRAVILALLTRIRYKYNGSWNIYQRPYNGGCNSLVIEKVARDVQHRTPGKRDVAIRRLPLIGGKIVGN